jgi:heat-inducible transcriptional repressor
MAEIIQTNGRARKLLRTLVELYIACGEPVSSAALSNAIEIDGERVPPSTIRLELNRLEASGYLTKPHASGGRIPTSRAYREYADSLEPGLPDLEFSRKVFEACRALAGELRRLLEYAGEVLAIESGCLSFITSPSLADSKISRFKLDPIESQILLIRLEMETGRYYHHLVKLPLSVQNFRLDALTEILTNRLAGRRLMDISEAELVVLVNKAAELGRGYDIFIHPLHDLITDARLGEDPITVMHGAAGLLEASGDDPQTLARAVAFLDDRSKIEKTIGAVSKPEGASVVIGGDNGGDSTLDGLALIVASYHLHIRAKGRLGILGPLRMPYAKHLSLVLTVSDQISRVLISKELSPRFS